MSYRLKKASETTAFIFQGRTKVGHAVRKANSTDWYGTMTAGRSRVEAHGSLTEVFHELAARANRIALCGVDDREKALAALDQRNAETARRNQQTAAEGQQFLDLVRDALHLGPAPRSLTHRRPRSRKIAL